MGKKETKKTRSGQKAFTRRSSKSELVSDSVVVEKDSAESYSTRMMGPLMRNLHRESAQLIRLVNHYPGAVANAQGIVIFLITGHVEQRGLV